MAKSQSHQDSDSEDIKPPTRGAILALGLLAIMFGIAAGAGLVLGDVIRYEAHQDKADQNTTLSVAYLRDVSERLSNPQLAIAALPKIPAKRIMRASPAAQASKAKSLKAHIQFNLPVTWQTRTFDSQIQLEMLNKQLSLAETDQKTGLETFFYTAYLYRQMADQVKDPILAKKLSRLSSQADSMGNTLQRAMRTQFEGRPNEDMTHLQVRASMAYELGQLSQSPLRLVDYNKLGAVISQSPIPPAQPGPLTQQFEANLAGLQSQQYPQTVTLARQHGMKVSKLARNLELRWESVFECSNTTLTTCLSAYSQNTPAKGPRRMRIYVRQNWQPS